MTTSVGTAGVLRTVVIVGVIGVGGVISAVVDCLELRGGPPSTVLTCHCRTAVGARVIGAGWYTQASGFLRLHLPQTGRAWSHRIRSFLHGSQACGLPFRRNCGSFETGIMYETI